MPRYHFNVHDGKSLIDIVGTELADEPQARQEAIRLAGKILEEDCRSLASGEDWTMEVTDRVGLLLFRLDFYVTGSPVIHPPGLSRASGMTGGQPLKRQA